MRIFQPYFKCITGLDLNVFASFVQRYKVLSKHMRYDFVHMGIFTFYFNTFDTTYPIVTFLKHLIWNNQKAILMFLHD